MRAVMVPETIDTVDSTQLELEQKVVPETFKLEVQEANEIATGIITAVLPAAHVSAKLQSELAM